MNFNLKRLCEKTFFDTLNTMEALQLTYGKVFLVIVNLTIHHSLGAMIRSRLHGVH